MNYEGKYAELLGLESDTNCQVRSDNYHSVIDEYEDLEMVAQQSANWDQTEAYEKTEAILQSNPEITGIICGNDTMACGAVQACLDAGRNDIKIIGLDGSDEANAYIKSGDMVGTALQPVSYTHLDVYKRQLRWWFPDKPSGSLPHLLRGPAPCAVQSGSPVCGLPECGPDYPAIRE